MSSAFLVSALAVFLAEMGDKTQLLAMAFSTRYRWYTVLWAVTVATALNHLLAVVAGNLITHFIPIAWVKLMAAISFLLFALWTLHDDSDPETHGRPGASPFWVVGIAFFLAEMGDKTQLMTMTLSADQAATAGALVWAERIRQILPVWGGTTVGMVLADAIGIVAGVVMHKHIPTHVIKWVAAVIFAVFGFLGLNESLGLLCVCDMVVRRVLIFALMPIMGTWMVIIARRNARRKAAALKRGDAPA